MLKMSFSSLLKFAKSYSAWLFLLLHYDLRPPWLTDTDIN